jgi:hypothetical protein
MAEAAMRKIDSPTRHPSPFDRHDGSASNATLPTSDPICQIEHSAARFQPSRARNTGVHNAACEQRSSARTPQEPSVARGAINLHEIARPEILDPGGIERDHMQALCFLFVPPIEHHELRRQRELSPCPYRRCVAMRLS